MNKTSGWKFNRARELRKAQGRTCTWLAQKCGVTPQYVTLLLAGKRTPSMAVLINLAAALETTVDELLGNTVAA